SAYKKAKKEQRSDADAYSVRISYDDPNNDFMLNHYKENLQYAIEKGNQKDILYYTAKLDPEFRNAEYQFWHAQTEIQEMRVDQTVKKEDFEKACQDQMLRAYAFKRPYEKYYQQPLYGEVFKIYAIFLEREGRYVDAATVCAKALRWGFPNDRTQGGMKGRLLRLVKKTGGEVNAEIADALKKYCQ
ncbi:MAG: hypothetical protein IIU58_02795, partial [Clostridia bacterium]|nr:hypothetical protein [Clostridia bacterium]